ncbi:hypothetical protein GE061_000201 [Apolygus lucorum]|uniref:RNA-directed RNA polymerase C-terminal domain-containing protein n=1 Tax=Apolygus lucorum TaxID=248454 RepID=A0A8S9Y697_APOLU|nr:hypothetical protein GE061_000201 [Apolygus lucorum]
MMSDRTVQLVRRLEAYPIAPSGHTEDPPDNLDAVSWIPSSAAGFGYIGKKADNYLLARKNATRVLTGYSKWKSSYRFSPDKSFARTQLAMRAHPKIRHVWGRAFHHIHIEGLIGQPLLLRLMEVDTPIYIGKDIHKDMPYCILEATADGGTCYCIDFSKFDASVSSGLVLGDDSLFVTPIPICKPADIQCFFALFGLTTSDKIQYRVARLERRREMTRARPALHHVYEQLSDVGLVRPIRPDNLDAVSWIPSSAAGFGYIGKKADNYLLARKNATRALTGYSKWEFLPFRPR